jgi:hypothetical protein
MFRVFTHMQVQHIFMKFLLPDIFQKINAKLIEDKLRPHLFLNILADLTSSCDAFRHFEAPFRRLHELYYQLFGFKRESISTRS